MKRKFVTPHETYPCLLFSQGIPLRWYVRQPNGVDAGPLLTWEDARDAALSYNNSQPILALCTWVQMFKVVLGDDGVEKERYLMGQEVPFTTYGIYAKTDAGDYEHLIDSTDHAAAVRMLELLTEPFETAEVVSYEDLLELTTK